MLPTVHYSVNFTADSIPISVISYQAAIAAAVKPEAIPTMAAPKEAAPARKGKKAEEKLAPAPPICPSNVKQSYSNLVSYLTTSTLLEKNVPNAQRLAGEFLSLKDKENATACEYEFGFIHDWVSKTTGTIPYPRVEGLERGMNTTIVVNRTDTSGANKLWQYNVTTGPLGEWRASYGFVLMPNRDKVYRTRDIGNGQFVIEKQDNDRNWSFAPTVFFSWFNASRSTTAYDWGWNAGLGLDLSNPTIMFGYEFCYYQNLYLNAGIGFNKQKRLKTEYSTGQVVNSTITPDSLVEDKFGPNLYVAFTFRFGSNPFDSSQKKSSGQ